MSIEPLHHFAENCTLVGYREKDQRADDAIEAIGFRDYCIGFDAAIQDWDPEVKLQRRLILERICKAFLSYMGSIAKALC